MQERWRAHLCGLCLTLRDEAGQSARVLTGYDALLLSVLVEAQAGLQSTTTAGRCPLRGLRTAEVLRADLPASQLAAAGSLLGGATGLEDKLADRDLVLGTRTIARLARARYEKQGVRLAGPIHLDPATVLNAPAAANAAEARTETSVEDLLAPTGAVVAALFVHTAVVAGTSGNAPALARLGDAFGRLVHLLDAVDDRSKDDRRGAFNPLTASGTTRSDAHRLARTLTREIADALDDVAMVEPALARSLLGPEVDRAVSRSFPAPGVVGPVLALSGVASLTLCGRRRRKRRRDSCADSLACDCCCDSCDCCECVDCCSC